MKNCKIFFIDKRILNSHNDNKSKMSNYDNVVNNISVLNLIAESASSLKQL